MYKLYYMPGACSLAIHALLNELELSTEIIDRSKTQNFELLESRGMVPVLVDNGHVIREGAAIILYLLENSFVCGKQLTVVDMMLTVYASWGEYFPVDIVIGERTREVIAAVHAHPAFAKAVYDEQQASQ